MVIYNCLDGVNQRWYNDDLPGANQYWIKNQVCGKCLTVQIASMASNAPVVQYTCNLGANEVWYHDDQGFAVFVNTASGLKLGRVYKIGNQKSGLCLTARTRLRPAVRQVLQYDCHSPGGNAFIEG